MRALAQQLGQDTLQVREKSHWIISRSDAGGVSCVEPAVSAAAALQCGSAAVCAPACAASVGGCVASLVGDVVGGGLCLKAAPTPGYKR